MHILGLANGTPKGNSEILLKAALHAASQKDSSITTSWIHVPSVLIPRNPPALQGALDISLGVNKSMLNRDEKPGRPADNVPNLVTTTTGETTTEASANATQPPNESALDDTSNGIVELSNHNPKTNGVTNGNTTKHNDEIDDRLAVLNAILDADAIIFATPVYNRQPAGSLKAVIDRILGPYTDASFAVRATERRKAGDPRFQDIKIDERLLKPRVVGFICAAASRATDQVTMALSSLHTMVFSLHAKVVDQVVCHGVAVPGMAAWMQDGAAVKRAQRLGQNIVSEIGKPFEEAKYLGDTPRGACPYCHLAKIDILGTPDNSIECVTCGAQGRLVQADDGIFEPLWAENCDISSITMAGKMHHLDVIEMGSKRSASILSDPEFHRKKNEWLSLGFPLVDLPSQH